MNYPFKQVVDPMGARQTGYTHRCASVYVPFKESKQRHVALKWPVCQRAVSLGSARHTGSLIGPLQTAVTFKGVCVLLRAFAILHFFSTQIFWASRVDTHKTKYVVCTENIRCVTLIDPIRLLLVQQ